MTSRMRTAREFARAFLAGTGVAALGFAIVPRHVLGGARSRAQPARESRGHRRGGMGGGDIATHKKNGANIVALCDVDDERGAGTFGPIPRRVATRIFAVDRQGSEEHRRRDGRHAGPCPRRGGDGGHPGGQARVLSKAAHAHAP